MQDTAKNLAFLSRRVSALEKKVQSLEANLVDSIVTQHRMGDVVAKITEDLEGNTELGHQMTKYFSERHADTQRAIHDLHAELKGLDLCKCQ